jgi:DNA repair exonuclease SbcCD ATPase subunit
MDTVKQLKELEEAAVKAEDSFQEQMCKLKQALQESTENSLLLEQQVYSCTSLKYCSDFIIGCEFSAVQRICMCSVLKQCMVQVKELSTSLEDQQECQRKLEEAIAFEKEKLESSQVNCKDLEEQIVYANSTLKGEHDARMKLSEEVLQLNEMLEQSMAEIARAPCAEHVIALVGTNFLILSQDRHSCPDYYLCA